MNGRGIADIPTMKPLRLAAVLLIVVSAAVVSMPRAAAQTPLLVAPSMVGRDLFDFYCAGCHGRDARGNGPASAALVAHVPDLTTLSAGSHGTFPKERVIAILNGETKVRTHGSKEMPVWGPIFQSLDPVHTRNATRVVNIVDYLESLQRPPR